MQDTVRRVLPLVLVFALVFSVAGCAGSASPSPTSAPASQPTSAPKATAAPSQATAAPAESGGVIKIGVIGPLSGTYAYTGESIANGVKLAAKEANAEGGLPGGAQVELLVGDDRGTPAEAVALAQKYVNEDKVAAVVGPFNSATTAAVKEIFINAKIPHASTGAASDDLTAKDVDYYFRPHMYNALQSTQFAKYIVQTLNKKRLGIIFENNDWGKGLDSSMSELFAEMGAEMVAREGFNTGTTDFTAALTKIKGTNPDAVIAIALITDAAVITKQAAELGIKGEDIIGLGSFDQDKLYELVGPLTNGIKFMMWYAPEHPEIKAAKVFADAYQKEYNSIPDSFAAQGYTAAKSILLGIKNAGSTDGTAIRDAIEKLDFESPIGRITFGPDHNARASVFMAEWQDGKKVLLPEQPKIE